MKNNSLELPEIIVSIRLYVEFKGLGKRFGKRTLCSRDNSARDGVVYYGTARLQTFANLDIVSCA